MSAIDNGEAAFAPVLEAMTVMRTGSREEKKAAHSYLEVFQKSVCSAARGLEQPRHGTY